MSIREVARIAKVSTATVSRTINGSEKVSEETAKRVRKAIDRLRYYPDTNARTLGSGRSNLYGLIISDITNPFFPELVKTFEDIAIRHGQEVLVGNTDYDRTRTEHCVRRMLQRRVDGVAIMTSELDPSLITDLNSHGIPLVFLDTVKPQQRVSSITIDYAAGIDQAVRHLCKLGHERIAFVAGPSGHQSSRLRREGFRASMRRIGKEVPAGSIQGGGHTIVSGHAAMVKLLKQPVRPQAVIASNDLTAIGALGAIHEAGLRVPEDISLIGFDDIAICSYLQPPLTTVRIPRRLIAETAFKALFEGERKGTEYRIAPELVLRRSTASVDPSKK